MVFLGRGSAEHGDDGVADELLDRPAAERDLRLHRVVEAVEQVARVLRVERRAQLRRADEVGEQDGRELALHWGECKSHIAQVPNGAADEIEVHEPSVGERHMTRAAVGIDADEFPGRRASHFVIPVAS